MLTITLAVFLGILFTLVASQNPPDVNVNIFGYLLTIPIYMVSAASFLAGIMVTSIFNILDLTAANFDLRKREDTIKNVAKNNQNLQKEIQRLDDENIKLRENLDRVQADFREKLLDQRRENIKKIINKIRH